MSFVLKMNVLIVGFNLLYLSVLMETLHAATNSKVPTTRMSGVSDNYVSEDDRLLATLNENHINRIRGLKRNIDMAAFIFFSFKRKGRYLLTYMSEATDNLFSNAKRVRAAKNQLGKTLVMKKPGSFVTAQQDFQRFQPYHVEKFTGPNGIVGLSGKIRGNTGKVVSGRDVHIPGHPNESPELQIVVRNKSSSSPYSPTLELFPLDQPTSRSFRLKMRYQ